MALKLMYITNNPTVAQIAEAAGVDRIFVDMEYIGKSARQGGMNTVQNHHTIEDVKIIKETVTTASVLCRINPIHESSNTYCSSKEEIDGTIEAGADILMLPYFKTIQEVKKFIELVDGRVKTMPLVETPESVEIIDDILKLDGIDEIFIGLNDLSLGYKKKFMFELLSDGTVEKLCIKFKTKGIPYGFGGIASLGKGLLPSEFVIREHYRLESTRTILSRSFCNPDNMQNMESVKIAFYEGLAEIRSLEAECEKHSSFFQNNEREIAERVKCICDGKNR